MCRHLKRFTVYSLLVTDTNQNRVFPRLVVIHSHNVTSNYRGGQLETRDTQGSLRRPTVVGDASTPSNPLGWQKDGFPNNGSKLKTNHTFHINWTKTPEKISLYILVSISLPFVCKFFRVLIPYVWVWPPPTKVFPLSWHTPVSSPFSHTY